MRLPRAGSRARGVPARVSPQLHLHLPTLPSTSFGCTLIVACYYLANCGYCDSYIYSLLTNWQLQLVVMDSESLSQRTAPIVSQTPSYISLLEKAFADLWCVRGFAFLRAL